MTRVECLYRVSTKGQVDHDDIPMQRIECRKFAEQQGWNIIKELCEREFRALRFPPMIEMPSRNCARTP